MSDEPAVPWLELETRGYLVMPGFLTADEVELFVEDYTQNAQRAQIDYGTSTQVLERPTSVAVLEPIRSKIKAVLDAMTGATSLKADTIIKAYYFASDVFTYSWHQDMDFWAQDRRDLFNFYIPIVKPSPELTNLSVVPHDVLCRVPDADGRFEGRGGRTLRSTTPGSTEVLDVCEGTRFAIGADIESLGVTPHLRAGDLLLLRGDLVHRTQDAATKRVALSIRVAHSKSVIDRRALLSGASSKRRIMRGLIGEYGPILRCFEVAGAERIELGDLVAFAESAAGSAPISAAEFDEMLQRASAATRST